MALLAEVLFLLLALALGGATLVFPTRTSSGDFGLQFLFASGVVLDQLIERGSGDVYLVQALKLLTLERNSIADTGQQVDLFDQFGRDAGQGL